MYKVFDNQRLDGGVVRYWLLDERHNVVGSGPDLEGIFEIAREVGQERVEMLLGGHEGFVALTQPVNA